jgi:hypothetical protein
MFPNIRLYRSNLHLTLRYLLNCFQVEIFLLVILTIYVTIRATGITLQLVWWTIGPSIGPSISVAGEISEARLRAKSQSIGFTFNYVYSTVWNVVLPYMFNPGYGDLGGKMGWIFLATSLIALLVVYFEFPETKDMSFKLLDEAFQEHVPTRNFKGYATRSENPKDPEVLG